MEEKAQPEEGMEKSADRCGIEMEVEKLQRMQRKTRKTISKLLDGLCIACEELEHPAVLKGSCGHCTGCAGSDSNFEESSVRVSENLGIVYKNTCYMTPMIMFYGDSKYDKGWRTLAWFRGEEEGWELKRAVGKVASILIQELKKMPGFLRERRETITESNSVLEKIGEVFSSSQMEVEVNVK
jgi:hypothetical protein